MTEENPDSQLSKVENLLFQGRKIDAIKLYRENTGDGLKEAKEAVEDMEAGLRALSPEKFKKPAGASGCMGVVVLAATLSTVACMIVGTIAFVWL